MNKEDKFQYQIADNCINCGKCQEICPVNAIIDTDNGLQVNEKCIDCGSCAAVCPVNAANPGPVVRESVKLSDIDADKLYVNPGCALSEYKPHLVPMMVELLKTNYPQIKEHHICCHHDPKLPEGSTIIANCAGCDRRFRSLYDGVNTISFWEVVDSFENVVWPDHSGLTVSVHDSCSYRHKPQVHKAIRSLLKKMNIEIVESEFSGTNSVCCGDNWYVSVPNQEVEKRIQMRADQMPCDDVVVYCIGCVRAMQFGGKRPRYMIDLLFAQNTESMPDSLDEYHGRVCRYIDEH